MNNITQLSRGQGDWQRLLSIAAMFMVSMVIAFAMTGCGGGGGGGSSTPAVPVVAAPGAPTGLTATAGENEVTLQWSPPAVSATAGVPVSYEIYRSTTATTAATIVNSTNFVTSIPVVTGMLTSYTDTGLAGGSTTYYYVVTAKNAGGETPSTVASAKPTGSANPVTYGNNFSAALIFADDIGITNLALDPAKSWAAGTADVTAIDTNTGLRPLASEIPAISAVQATLPYTPLPSKIDPSYYEQKSVNTWQGEWAAASGVQDVTAKWGDNLTGTASLSAGSKIRIEMVLTKDVSATPMTAYTMKLLSGSGINELWGTNKVTYNPVTAFVFATNAHLTIHKLDAGGNEILPAVDDQALFDPAIPDGLNKLSAEIPVSGNFTYGYVWNPSTTGSIAGKYRITFILDPTSQFGLGHPANNTFIQTVTNGVQVSPNEVYIDVDLK